VSAETDLQGAISKRIKIFDQQKRFALSNAANFVTMESTELSAIPNDAREEVTPGLEVLRNQIFGFRGLVTPSLASYLPAYMRILAVQEANGASLDQILYHLYQHAAIAPVTVKSRAIVFNSPAAGSNSGTGAITRLTKDRYNYPIEAGSAEAKTWTCIADEHNPGGARHQELFELTGAANSRSIFPMPGQGARGQARVLSILDSAQYLQNPGFEQYDGTSGFTGWIPSSVGVWSNFAQHATYYKDVPGATPYSLQFLNNDSVKQTFTTQQLRWPPGVPLYAQLAWQRLTSADGTLSFQIGGKTASVAVNTGTNGVWNVLRWPVAAPDQDAWFRRWNTQNAEIKITLSGRTTGTVLVDDVICGPYAPWDYSWFAIVGGATPFLRDDVFTATDTETGAINQEWLARAFPGFYLPAVTGGAETWGEPA
jgi:hypothetical protein